MENKKEKNRREIIYTLAQYAHQDCFKSLLYWPTESLIILLGYYEKPIEKKSVMEIGIDEARDRDETTISMFIGHLAMQ